MTLTQNIVWFTKTSKNDLPIVGGKAANLGELTQIKMPVPQGFTVTTKAYEKTLTDVLPLINEKLKEINTDDTNQLQQLAEETRKLILSTEMNLELKQEIENAYEKMKEPFVAVRSSATAEDLPTASFAGQQDTYLNIKGKQNVIKHVQDCWASLYTARAILYRVVKKVPHEKIKMAVVIQEMVPADTAGVLFTTSPLGDRTKMIMETVHGLGETLVSGQITPDNYVLNKDPLKILEKHVNKQDWKLTRDENGETTKQPVKPELREKQKLKDDEILRTAELGLKIEKHYQHPQDVEFAISNGKILILQTRPITTLKN